MHAVLRSLCKSRTIRRITFVVFILYCERRISTFSRLNSVYTCELLPLEVCINTSNFVCTYIVYSHYELLWSYKQIFLDSQEAFTLWIRFVELKCRRIKVVGEHSRRSSRRYGDSEIRKLFSSQPNNCCSLLNCSEFSDFVSNQSSTYS